MDEYLKFLGMPVKDKITGFSGCVDSVSFDLYGCVVAAVMPGLDEKGVPRDGKWFDIKRLDITGERVMDVPKFARMRLGDEGGPAEKPGRDARHS